ncbi:hypothetical protein CEXT_654922 [Caerostris extrusa]|uniref:BRCT domain-containing protein n=1 Tax=Caerostris extrusa TaxID=172846 RepID=A0AAV4QJ51_CAEEX|nr:hypothetical protein CEXT_654922 [Caerostris extrusa]
MFLDDSFELDLTDHIDNAEAMPLASEFNLKDIYIPKNLLPNRERLKDPNEKRPYIFHTLDSFDVENRFSVYSEENHLEYHETEISENILPSSTSQTLVNDNIFEFISNASPLKSNLISKNIENDSLDNEELKIDCSKNFNFLSKVTDIGSFYGESNYVDTDHIKLSCSEASDADNVYHGSGFSASVYPKDIQQQLKNTFSQSKNSAFRKIASFDTNKLHFETMKPNKSKISANNRIGEKYNADILESSHHESEKIHSKFSPLSPGNLNFNKMSGNIAEKTIEVLPERKNDCQNVKIIETEKLQSIIDSKTELNFAANIIDSLEELHFSNVESSEKNPELLKTNISDLSCSVQNEDINDKMFNMSSEKIQDSKLADNKMCETEFADSIQSIINTDSDSKQEIFHKDELSDNVVEKVIELPIPYRRPDLEQNNVKVRSQKGKKKASKTKKNMSLQKFFLVDTPVDSTAVDDFHNRFEVPKNDKFYENLISKHEYREHSYEDSTNIYKLPTSYQENFLENRLIFNEEQKGWAGKTSFSEVVNTNVSVNVIDETKTIEPKKKEKNSSKILIIDKIPLSVSEKDIENITLGFGTIIKILITRHGMFLKAKLEMDFICDIDWVIECLNNSQPFVYGEQPIKCYQQC